MYQNAGYEAYQRLKWHERNRPSFEDMERARQREAEEEIRRKIKRLRRGVA